VAQNTVTLRQAADLPQAALADITGIPLRTLARRETGQSRWTTDEIDAIATAFGVAATDLVTEGGAHRVLADRSLVAAS
jgi:transcriptional regulator with XRE-family HTH domain